MKNGWPTVELGKALKLCIDAVPTTSQPEFSIAGVYGFGRGLFTRESLPSSQTTYKCFHRLHAGDFVISVPKGWEGALSQITDEFDGMFLSPVFPTFRADKELLDIRYLDWFCKRSCVWDDLRRRSRGIGARRESLSPEAFLATEIPLPPVTEQRRIVARIEQLAAQIEEARRLRHQATEETEALRRMASGRLFDKEGEEACCLGDVSSRITKGESPKWQGFSYQEAGPIFVRSENVLWGKLDLSEPTFIPAEFHAKLSRSQLQPGDVLINLVGASIGRACVVPQEIGDANVNQAVAVISPDPERLDSDYLMRFLISRPAQEILHGGKVDTARANISLGDLRELRVPLPCLPEQRRIVGYLDGLAGQVAALARLQSETAAELNALLPSILDKAFKGEL
jgi:type I restriction enzyme, S subunit